MADGVQISKALAYAVVESPFVGVATSKAVAYAVIRPGVVHIPAAPSPPERIWLLRGDGGHPEQFFHVPFVRSIDWDNETVDALECSHLESTCHEYTAGVHDFGTLDMDVFALAGDKVQQGLWADYFNGVTRNFRLVVPDDRLHQPETFDLSGIVTAYEHKFTMNSAEVIHFTLKLTVPHWSQKGVFISKAAAYAVVVEV